MNGKRRQYVPPALGGSPAYTGAAERLLSLRRGARPLESSLPAQSAQATDEQATTGIHQCAPSLKSGSSQVLVPAVRACTHTDSAATTTAVAATAMPCTREDDLLHLPRPRSYAGPPLTSSTSSSPAPASVAAAAAAAVLLKIQNRQGNCKTDGGAHSSQPSCSKGIPQSSSCPLAAGPPSKTSQPCSPPQLSLQRPPSAVASTTQPAREAPERSHPTTSSASLSPQCMISPSSSPTSPPSDASQSATGLYREALWPDKEAGHSDVFKRVSVIQARLKRPRESDVSAVSDDEDEGNDGGDGGRRCTIGPSSFSPHSSSSSAEKASAPPAVGNKVATGLPRTPGEGDNVMQSREELADGWATRPTAAWSGLLPRPLGEDASGAPRPQHPLGLASLPPYRAAAPSDEEVEQATFSRETEEEEEDMDADEETGEEDGGCGRRSVVQSDPLRVVVDFAQLQRVVASSKTSVAAAPGSGAALQQVEELEALLADNEEGVGPQRNARQANTDSCGLEAEREAHEVASARAFLEKRARADVHRRATQAACTPAPPSELLLGLLQHLPSAPGRAIYDRSSCPPVAAVSAFSDDFHKHVQKFMTHIVLQRDGRTGSAPVPSVSDSDAAGVPPASVSCNRPRGMKLQCTKQKQKEVEVEQLVEAFEKGMAADVRDVVAYSRCIMQEQLHQEHRRVSKRRSPLSKTAVDELERNRCSVGEERAVGDVLTSDQHQRLADLRAVVEQKLSIMRLAAEAENKEREAESVALHTKRTGSKGSSEGGAKEAPVAHDAGLQDTKAVLVAAHARFMDAVRCAAASRRERAEAAQAAEQRLEATVAAWRRSYDRLLTRELNCHRMGRGPDKPSRREARSLQPKKSQRTQRHQPQTDLWEMTKGMSKSEREHLNELVKAAANALPLPPFKYPPPPTNFPQ